MQIYEAPIDDMLFLLRVFGYEQNVAPLEAFEAFDFETVEAILRQAAAMATETWLPCNGTGDHEGLKWDPQTGDVTTPEGFQRAYTQMVELGFVGICAAAADGGGGGPMSLGAFLNEIWTTTNKSLSMCPGLTNGMVEALHRYAGDEIKDLFMEKLITGKWAGTMCLTEAQCGTDLGMLRTKAVPDGDRYRLTGTKIWITFGEHDLTENIVHLVLARLADAPEGIKGISCFVVPKITPEGKRNGVKCTGLEHKMGIKASPTCVIDLENAEGWLVGEPHKGMRSMFVMMNSARLLVGNEGVSLSEIAYQTALQFAKDRRQSRSLDPAKRDADAPADNILVHPDVRRMLMNVKSTHEGMRGLVAFVANLIDVGHAHPDEAAREEAQDVVGLLTPVIKGYCTERGFLNVSECMQVCGGAGYTVDWSIEQYLRDVRIAMIYEGTNHIQALDLVGRKLPRNGGRAFHAFMKRAMGFALEQAADDQMKEFAEPLQQALAQLVDVTTELGGKGMEDPEEIGAAASNYLTLFGLAGVAFCWAKQCRYVLDNPDAQSDVKLKTARYYFNHVLPERHGLVAKIAAGKADMMALAVDEL